MTIGAILYGHKELFARHAMFSEYRTAGSGTQKKLHVSDNEALQEVPLRCQVFIDTSIIDISALTWYENATSRCLKNFEFIIAASDIHEPQPRYKRSKY